MEIWLAASLFFGGALCYGVIAKLMELGHMYNHVKETTDKMVFLLISVSMDVAFIKKLKYESMERMEVSEEEIDLIKSIDREQFESWKNMCLLKFFEFYPKNYKKILSDYDWTKITTSVDELYK